MHALHKPPPPLPFPFHYTSAPKSSPPPSPPEPSAPEYVLVQTAKIRITSIEGVQRVGKMTVVYLVGGATLTFPAEDYYRIIKAMS